MVLAGAVVSAAGMRAQERQVISMPAGCMVTPVNSRAPVAVSKLLVVTESELRGPPPSSMHWLLTVSSKATAGPADGAPSSLDVRLAGERVHIGGARVRIDDRADDLRAARRTGTRSSPPPPPPAAAAGAALSPWRGDAGATSSGRRRGEQSAGCSRRILIEASWCEPPSSVGSAG